MEELRDQLIAYQDNSILSSAEYVAVLFDEENLDCSTVLVNTDVASLALAISALYEELRLMWSEVGDIEDKDHVLGLIKGVLKPLEEAFYE